MSELTNIDQILDFAIQMEQDAVDLYTGLAERATGDGSKKTFLAYAAEEHGHKSRLEHVKSGGKMLSAESNVQDLKIADYANDVELDDAPTYQDVLIFAMKQEKQAFRLYTDLAGKTDDAAMKEVFLGLAQEEAKHKLRFELEYDEHVLTEN